MNKLLFATAFSLVALAGAPAFAQVQGYVAASATNVQIDDVDGDANLYNVGGAVALPLTGAFGVQVDGAVHWAEIDDLDTDPTGSAVVHLYLQDEDSKFGVFLGGNAAEDANSWTGGVEGQAVEQNIKIYGSLGYMSMEDADLHGVALQGGAKVFVTDNFTVGAQAGINTLKAFDEKLSAKDIGVGVEYQLSNVPVSFFAGYNRTWIESDFEVDQISVGVTYSFGIGTLRQRETTGPSLSGGGVNSLLGLLQ